jgi:pimeloyl-ACP methyl ester carboxylesterase
VGGPPVSTFAFVHGGWHGAWCWDLVAAQLPGHRVVAVDLPAEDPAAGAAEYASVVLAALDRTAGEDVVLVGHSLGGLTVPVVAQRLLAAGRPVRHLVLLAAMLPVPGLSVDDRARAGERQTRRGLGRNLVAHEDGSTSWDPDAAVGWLYPDSSPDVARAAAARLRPQQFRVTAEPSPLTAWPDVPSTYVLCTADQVIDDGWARAHVPDRLVELPGDHSPFLARPVELAGLLLRLVA